MLPALPLPVPPELTVSLVKPLALMLPPVPEAPLKEAKPTAQTTRRGYPES